MKKIGLILVAIFLALGGIVLTGNISKADIEDCPDFPPECLTCDNLQWKKDIFYMSINGCQYRVVTCTLCPISAAGGCPESCWGRLYIISRGKIDPTCEDGLTDGQIDDSIRAAFMDPDYMWRYKCGDFTPAPCADHSSRISISFPICNYKELILDQNGDPILVTHTCEDDPNWCTTVYVWCWMPDPPPNGSYVLVGVDGPFIYGEPTCPDIEPPDPVELYSPTECYIIHSDCYPEP